MQAEIPRLQMQMRLFKPIPLADGVIYNDGNCRILRSSSLGPNRALLTCRNYTPVKIGIKLTGKTSGVRVWIPFIPKPARLEVICKKLAKICIFLPKKSIKISFIIKSGLQIVFLSSMGYQEHIL